MHPELCVILPGTLDYTSEFVSRLSQEIEGQFDFELILFSLRPFDTALEDLKNKNPRFYYRVLEPKCSSKEAQLNAIQAARGQRILLLPPCEPEVWSRIFKVLGQTSEEPILFIPNQGLSRLGRLAQWVTGVHYTADPGFLGDRKSLSFGAQQLELENRQFFPLLPEKDVCLIPVDTKPWGLNKGYSYWVELYHVTLGRWVPFSFLQYCVVGGSGVFVNLGVLNLLILLNQTPQVALLWALEISIINNFFFNNSWTFRAKQASKWNWVKGLAKFHVVCSVGAGINYGTVIYLLEKFGLNLSLADLLGILLATVWNYYMNKRFTWGLK